MQKLFFFAKISQEKTHKFSLVRYVPVEIFELFLGMTKMTPVWPKVTSKTFKRFYAIFVQIFNKLGRIKC